LDETLDKLNEFVRIYAGGIIKKLRPSADNTVDIRISLNDGEDSITFDGLSSGQKEIISTLFLIWYHTKDKPSVVFIDEPELHLNAQWHRSFVKTLIKLVPENQYIIATHSEDVMDSVDADRRVLLTDDQENI
ncbi:MAG: ATP-binding protein, partial [Desulfobacula sp.]|nr:ATP-binding protein [Desulfobacula sp.]